MNSSSTFSGSQLRAARHKRGWTQAELARRAGVRERQIIRWENEQHAPRFAAMVALAHTLGVGVEALCEHGDPDEEDSPAMPTDILRVLYSQLGVALGEKVA